MFPFVLYTTTLLLLTVFSYGFVEVNMPFKTLPYLYDLVHLKRSIATLLYGVLMVLLFVFYGYFLLLVKRKKLTQREIFKLIGVAVVILLFSFPAFSHDIFNYIATAKVTFFYKENPYIVMPIEIPNEPMLTFMHAANKTALYGSTWILLTAIPYFAGVGNLLLTIFTFKVFILFFYLGLSWLIWDLSKKNMWSLVFFALNPLVLVETLVSAHNDVVMMFFALLAFYFFKKKEFVLSVICLLFSILIKFATLFLLPVYAYLIYLTIRRRKIAWEKIWCWSAISMFVIFLEPVLSPIREELYAWYLIWPLTFVALEKRMTIFAMVSLAFSFGLLFRFAPFIYTREWGGTTPIVKEVVSFVPPFLVSIFYVLKKKI